jgi:Uncharacterized conserved protein
VEEATEVRQEILALPGKLYFFTNNTKVVFKQLKTNPYRVLQFHDGFLDKA